MALEQDFTLLTRVLWLTLRGSLCDPSALESEVWCVAELVEAHELHLQQATLLEGLRKRFGFGWSCFANLDVLELPRRL